MSHKTQTTVTHWIDLSEAEQFEHRTHGSGNLIRVLQIQADVVDGSLRRNVQAWGARILKSGELGLTSHVKFFNGDDLRSTVYPILAAHGIKVPS